jgi:hypothetical protein
MAAMNPKSSGCDPRRGVSTSRTLGRFLVLVVWAVIWIPVQLLHADALHRQELCGVGLHADLTLGGLGLCDQDTATCGNLPPTEGSDSSFKLEL